MKKFFTRLIALLLLAAMLMGLLLGAAAANADETGNEPPAASDGAGSAADTEGNEGNAGTDVTEDAAGTEDTEDTENADTTEGTEGTEGADDSENTDDAGGIDGNGDADEPEETPDDADGADEPVVPEMPENPDESVIPEGSEDMDATDDPNATETPGPGVAEDPDIVVDPNESDSSEISTTIIRIGLHYNKTVLDGANLSNSIGSGFYFGYYDDENNFIKVGQTNRSTLSVVKTDNVYYGYVGSVYPTWTYYDHLTSNSIGVGCYHLQLPGSYSAYEDAFAVASGYDGGFVAYISGTYYARIGNYLNRDDAVMAQNHYAMSGVQTDLKGTSAYGLSVVATGTNTIVFQYDDNGKGTGLGLEPIPTTEGEKCLSWFRGIEWNGGFRYERIDGGDMTIVNMVQLDDYIKGVISSEMVPTWPLEALKAQAVCARNYALYNHNRHKKYHFDLCYTTCCQAYSGRKNATEHTDTAVNETAGVIATCNGEIVALYYHSSNGGATECSSMVWGSKQEYYPYLIGVVDPYEELVKISGYSWTREYTAKELTSLLNSKGYACSTIVSAKVSEYSATGNPASVTFTDSTGKSYTLTAIAMQKVFPLQSWRYDFANTEESELTINGETPIENFNGLYTVDGSGNIIPLAGDVYVITDSGVELADTGGTASGDVFTIAGKGWGHNVGMSQYGAYSMAKLGFTFREILTFYYTGLEVD